MQNESLYRQIRSTDADVVGVERATIVKNVFDTSLDPTMVSE